VPYRRKKLTFAISSSDEFLYENGVLSVVYSVCVISTPSSQCRRRYYVFSLSVCCVRPFVRSSRQIASTVWTIWEQFR